MDSDQGKLFIGGISWETDEDKMKQYFSNYGEVLQTVIMRDKLTGKPRGFGFVVFADPSVLETVLNDKHTIDGRTVEAKRAMSREEQQTTNRFGNSFSNRMGGGGGNTRTKKIFVGGLPPNLSEEEFRSYFQTYGNVTDVVVMFDQTTQRPRGFGFISFDEEEAVERVLHKTFHELNGKNVEVKRALPKDANSNNASGGRSGGSGSYQSYGGGPGANSGSYEGSQNKYMQSQTAAGGYPSYGSSGYGAPSYGYGAGNTGSGYGGYGMGGYGGPPAPYTNPNAASGGYGSGGAQGGRSPWSNQAPTGYGSAGYSANAGYGSAPMGGPAGAAGGQSQNTAAGYGNMGYGYGGGYGGGDGYGRGGAPNSNPAGNADQGAVQGYMSGGGYGDANGSAGYSNSWRSDPSQAGYGASYGGGYGGPQPRQPQHQ